MIDYKRKYIRIYFWQAITIIMGFVSLFIVIPHLSSDKTIYGIYSVCTSLTIFFSYADLGFLSSGLKYAAEYYIQGDYKNEIRVVGFTAFFMIMTFLVVDVGIVIIGIKPTLIIPELLPDTENYRIAQTLVLTLAIGCPLMIAQRVLQVIFTIRVEDYKFQRIVIAGYCIRILSVFYFFAPGRYMICEYYIFYQLVSLLVIFASLFDIKKYGYKIKDFLRAFKFDKAVFNKEKSLSIASLIFMISMILYNELDQLAIPSIFNVESVALYATAFSLMTFVRSYCSLVYSPYSSRYNHFVGLGDNAGLVDFTNKMVTVFNPIIVLPIFTVAMFSTPLVVSWVGDSYVESASMMSWMVLSFALTGFTQPLTTYMTAREKNKKIVTGAILLPVLYWSGIIVLSRFMDVKSFAIMKFVAPAILVGYYWNVITKDVKEMSFKFVNFYQLLLRLIPSIGISIALSLLLKPYMRYTQGANSLIFNFLIIGLSIIVVLSSALIFNPQLRTLFTTNMKKLITYIR